MGTRGSPPAPPRRRARLGPDQRRDLLLDAAVALAGSGSVDEVTMEAVAVRAGVSRPLVYRYFASRDELLGAVYRREAENLHAQLAARVGAAGSLEAMFAALISGALAAAAERGPMFAALRSGGGWSRDVRREQRARDARTTRAFVARAQQEGFEPDMASAAVSMLLALVDSVLAQWRIKPTDHRAALLERTYMTIVRASLASLPRAAHVAPAVLTRDTR